MKIILVCGWIVVFVGDYVVANEPYGGDNATVEQLRKVFSHNEQVLEGLAYAGELEILSGSNPLTIRYQ